MRFGQGLLAALENEDELLDDEPAELEAVDPEVEAEQEAEDVDNAVEVASDDIEEAETQAEVLEDAATELEEVEEALEAMKAHEGDMPAFATKMLAQKLEGLHRRTGMTFNAYSGESADLSDAAVVASLEDSVKDRLKQLGEYIMKLLGQAKEFFKTLWDRLTSGAARVSARAKKLAAELKGKDITEDQAKEVAEKLVEKKGAAVKSIAVMDGGKLTISRDLVAKWKAAEGKFAQVVKDEMSATQEGIDSLKKVVAGEAADGEAAAEALNTYEQKLRDVLSATDFLPGGFTVVEKNGKYSAVVADAAEKQEVASLKDGLVDFASYGSGLADFAAHLAEATSDRSQFSKSMLADVEKLYKDMEKAFGGLIADADKANEESGKLKAAIVRRQAAKFTANSTVGAREGRKVWLKSMGSATVVIAAFVSAANSAPKEEDAA